LGREFYNDNTLNFDCGTCNYDLCENCYGKDKKDELPNNQVNMNMSNSQEIQLFSNALQNLSVLGEKTTQLSCGVVIAMSVEIFMMDLLKTTSVLNVVTIFA
jgi:hypothetical protein